MANTKLKPTISDCFVSVIAPLEEDELIVEDFIKETSAVLRKNYANYELILVDNGTKDKTVSKTISLLNHYPCLRLIRLSRQYPREIAVFAGFETAIGDFVTVLLPATDPAEMIPDLIKKLRNGNDIVYGLSKSKPRQSLLVAFGTAFFYWYIRRFLHLSITPRTTYFIALNRRAVNALIKIKSSYRNIRLLVSGQVGFKSETLSYRPLRRQIKNDGLLEYVNKAFDIMFTYSRHPLRFVSWLGILAGLFNLLYVLYIIAINIFKKRVAEGWTTLSLQTTAMFFFVFLILTVLAEYIGRILEETRNQPSYHIMEELTSKTLVADEARRNIVK